MLSSLCCFFFRGGRFSIGLRPKIGLKEVESRCVGGELAAEWADFGGERGIAIAVQSMLVARVVCFMRPRIDGPRPQRQALRHRSLGQAANDWARYRLGRQQQTVDDITGRAFCCGAGVGVLQPAAISSACSSMLIGQIQRVDKGMLFMSGSQLRSQIGRIAARKVRKSAITRIS
jgi:hypothetical protein